MLFDDLVNREVHQVVLDSKIAASRVGTKSLLVIQQDDLGGEETLKSLAGSFLRSISLTLDHIAATREGLEVVLNHGI